MVRTSLVLMLLCAQGALAQPAPRPSVMEHRWAVGAALSSTSVEPDVADSTSTQFTSFELAGRWRIRAPMELALSLTAGSATGFGLGGLFFDFRYRFLAEKKLNLYALAGLGALAIAHDGSTDDEKKGRGALRIGGGVEYRFDWLALFCELRIAGIAENKDLPEEMPETVEYELARYKLSAGSVALGVTFYL